MLRGVWHIAALCVASRAGVTPSGLHHHRVYMGEEDSDNNYPYVVAFYNEYSRLCTGTLISPNWVLTAAHCKIDETIGVQYGNMTVHRDKATTVRKVRKAIAHPGYRAFQLMDRYVTHNDIALIQVDDIPMKRIGNISVVDYRSLMGLPVTYAGFGMTLLSSSNETLWDLDDRKPLQIGRGVLTTCEGELALLCVVPKCAANSQSIYDGDSGGPLFYEDKIIGVMTALQSFPVMSQVTPVSPYTNWIHDVVNERPSTI